MEAGVELVGLYVRPDADGSLIAEAGARGCPVRSVDEASMARMSTTTTPQPEVAVARRPQHHLKDLSGHPVVVGVDIQDPGNAGTLIRSSLAAGATGVVFCGESVDPFSPKTIRASAGAVFGMPVLEAPDARPVLAGLKQQGLELCATDSSGSTDLYFADLRRPVGIIVGNEANGLDSNLMDLCDSVLRIPMKAGESLNVGVAASVVLFESLRQRRAAQ